MYIHIGGDKSVDEDEILFMIPKKTVVSSYDTRRAMSAMIGSGRVTELPGGDTQTYIVCTGERPAVYASSISSTVLAKRGM
ncbi:MAG: hypothetical protein IJC24_05000 [Clostridia bacterium]|nr:hypothetical protein [Clostridia bacterium]MBQ6704175.1 hypothetical protein [Clostridia bacterium]